ncbi:MAG: hypothetical protein ACOC7R_00575 [Planctomycetota bacterium]
MKCLTAICAVVVLVCVGATQAQMTLVEDFEAYDLDSSIHMQGYDSVMDDARWFTQANTSQLEPSERAFVVDVNGNQCLEATSQNPAWRDDDPDYNVVAMSMYDYGIYGEGTIYFCFMSDGQTNDMALQSNDKFPGWDYGGIETGDIDAPSYQGNLNSWTECGIIAHYAGGGNGEGWFRGRDGSSANPPQAGSAGYKDVEVDANYANEWTELWVQVDHANDRSKFYTCPAGGTPTIIMNPDGSEWWSMRNETRDNDAVLNIRFQMGYPWGDSKVCGIHLDNIAVDPTAMTLDRPDATLPPNPSEGTPGDLDGDGDVDLDDFVILKNAFGVDDGGDCDGDGDTDLDDFVILKTNFGA